jgi:dephospho-CoA kinase
MANSPCLKIGLTGGIGSGKTAASEFFSELGVPVIDADVISRELLQPDTEATRQVIEEFGADIVSGGNSIDRAKLRQLIFQNPIARKKLESIIHPMVRAAIARKISDVTWPYCIVVIPLLFEAGQQDLVDRILVIDIPTRLQIARAAHRDQTSTAAIQQIIGSQTPASERRARADDIIDNTGQLEDLKNRIIELDRFYRKLSCEGIS